MAERGFLVEELVYALEDEGRGLTFEYCEGVIVGAIVPGSFGFVRALDSVLKLTQEELNRVLNALVDDAVRVRG
jgi:hypothetical protein